MSASASSPPRDVSTTLTELEGKLKELERELAGAGPPVPAAESRPLETVPRGATPRSEAPPAPAPSRAAASPTGDARTRMSSLHAQLDKLDRFRSQLEASASDLMAEYERLLADIDADRPAPTASPLVRPPAPAPASSSTPGVVVAQARGPVDQPGEAQMLEGRIDVDAGPFADIATLARFEAALADMPGVASSDVRGFDSDRAMIDVVLDGEVALGAELRASFGAGSRITSVVGRHVTIALDA